MTKKKAYSYLRISTDSQRIGDGIRRQMEDSKRYAEKNGYELVDVIKDIGVSGFHGVNSKTGALSGFIRAIDDGTFKSDCVLIVESLDRLSRQNVLIAFKEFSDLLSKGVTIVTLIDGQIYSEDNFQNNIGQIYTSLAIMMRANEESATKSSRLRSSWEQKRKKISEKKLTRMIPSWIGVDDERTKFSVSKLNETTIERIFDLCINGMGIYSITRFLNGNIDKYPSFSKSNKWNSSYISKILHNQAVTGQFQPCRMEKGLRIPTGEVVEDYYPQIISNQQFLLAQDSLKKRGKNSAGRKGKTHANIFTNLVKCGECGGTMTYRDKGKPPKGGRYLHCQNSVTNNGCDKPAWRYDEFEAAFIEFVQEIDFSEVLDKDKQDEKNRVSGELAEAKKKLEVGLKTYEASIDNMTKSLPDSVLKSLGMRAGEINSENDLLKVQISELEIQTADGQVNSAQEGQEDFIEKYQKVTENISEDGVAAIRFNLNGILKKNIDRIEIFNGEQLPPSEVEQLPGEEGTISDKLRLSFTEKGYESVEQIETLLGTDYGQRLSDKFYRHFVVEFKNGVRNTVRPSADLSLIVKSEKMIKMAEEIDSKLVGLLWWLNFVAARKHD